MSLRAHANLTSERDLQPVSRFANAALTQTKELAEQRGIIMTREQTLFARDFLMGYYHRPRETPNAHIVWLRVPSSLADHFRPLLPILGSVIDPLHGSRQMRYSDYMKMEPPALAQKLRDERQHLLVFDDFAELVALRNQGTQVDERLLRGSLYWNWVTHIAHERLTIFILDVDGELLNDEYLTAPDVFNFLGTEYVERDLKNFTIDDQGTEAKNALDMIKTLNAAKACGIDLRN